MAKILISFYSPIKINGLYQIPCFYEGLLNAFQRAGNTVLYIISSDFLIVPWNGKKNKCLSNIDQEKLLSEVKSFNPDLIIAFNNSIPEGIDKISNAPFIIWDADLYYYCNDKDSIKNNIERYHFFSFTSYGYTQFKRLLKLSDNKVFKIKIATDVRAKKLDQEHNMAFIGTPFYLSDKAKQALKMIDRTKFKVILNTYRQNIYTEIDKVLLEKHNITSDDVVSLLSCSKRNELIVTLAPLGLHLWGPVQWLDIVNYSLDAFFNYHSETVYSIQHNQDIYNKSKIGISIAHAQNVSGYPWRCIDIMASNACLVSHNNIDLQVDFKNQVKIPTYLNSCEAYEVCKRLLNNESLRSDIVAASQEAIEKGFRFEHRLKEIQDIFSINLFPKESSRAEEKDRLQLMPNTVLCDSIIQLKSKCSYEINATSRTNFTITIAAFFLNIILCIPFMRSVLKKIYNYFNIQLSGYTMLVLQKPTNPGSIMYHCKMIERKVRTCLLRMIFYIPCMRNVLKKIYNYFDITLTRDFIKSSIKDIDRKS